MGAGAESVSTTTVRTWRTSSVITWASIGLFCLVGELWVMGTWLLSDDFRFSSGDRLSISSSREITIWVMQSAVVLSVVSAAWKVRQQCRRKKTFTFEAALFLGFVSTIWLDVLMNWGYRGGLYDQALVHTSTWGPYVPGWSSPGQEHQIVPLSGGWFGYVLGFAWALVTALLMRFIALRYWPHLKGARLALAALGTSIIGSILLEAACIQAGIYAYPRVTPGVTLFADQWYRMPLLNVASTGIFWGAIPFLIWHYHQTKGPESTILRGLGHLPRQLRPSAQTLACIGLMNVSVVGYFACFRLISLISHVPPLVDAPIPLV
ncbi:spirocyclase AveC family protein [Streptomyces sp. NPDC001404]|uniref:spirocyclase AveC family protein n=1 Tax=Streptomyces sp. NPDC001404 TaxID=3364571 RepID=UPI0036ACF52A